MRQRLQLGGLVYNREFLVFIVYKFFFTYLTASFHRLWLLLKAMQPCSGVFGLLVKLVGSYTVDPGLIPGSSKLRQKSVVGQEIANLQIWDFLKLEFLIQF